MKKSLWVLVFIIFFASQQTSFGGEKLDVKSQSFIDLGRYVETLEINEKENEQEESEIQRKEDTFARID